jgi:RecA-family ATPase
MLKALIEGGEFLGNKLDETKVVYLSEEPRNAFCSQLQETGININSENLSVLTVEDNHGLNWDKTFQLATRQALKTGAKLLVVDSWGRFAQFGAAEDEMSPAPTQRRVTLLRALMAQAKCAVFILHHVGKQAGRGLIDSGMGSSALAQQVDIAYSLSGEPARGEISAKKLKNDKCRAIQGVGRYADAIRDPIVVELTETGYVLSEFKGNEGSKETAVEFLSSFLADGPKRSTEVTGEGEQMGLEAIKLCSLLFIL